MHEKYKLKIIDKLKKLRCKNITKMNLNQTELRLSGFGSAGSGSRPQMCYLDKVEESTFLFNKRKRISSQAK
jgi:hypothetical protein